MLVTSVNSVLHVIPGIPYGGMQRVVAQLVTEQRRQGLDARVLCLYEYPLLLQELDERKIPYLTTGNLRPSFPGFWKYVSSLKETNSAIIHLHLGLLWSNGLGLITKKIPWIGHFHTYYSPRTIKSKLLHLINYHLLNACIGVSASVSDALHPWFTKRNVKIFTVLNGIEIPDESKIAFKRVNGSKCYGMATRLTEGKGVWEFIRVAELILKVQPDAKFFLAGEGPLRTPITDHIQDRGLASQISLSGHMKYIDKFWTSIDVALFTSPCDGFGLSIVEPMALGIPVVAYRTGCGSDEINPGRYHGLESQLG